MTTPDEARKLKSTFLGMWEACSYPIASKIADALDSLADQVESLNDEILTRHQDVARIVDNLQHELAEARESQKYWQGLWEKAANGVLGLQEDLVEARAEIERLKENPVIRVLDGPHDQQTWQKAFENMKAERDAWKDKFEKAFPPHDCVEIQEKYDAAAQWLHDCLGDSVREITETIQEQIAAKLAEKGKP